MSKSQNKALSFLYETYIGRIILKPLITRPVSDFVGKLLNLHISKILIKGFVKKNNINMDDYVKKEYTSFNDFFIRDIKDGKRPFDMENNHLASPCDAKVLAYKIDENKQFYIKNSWYTIGQLLENEKLAEKYVGGDCLIFRLEATDYHHYCYFDNGKQGDNIFIKGKFHTVQPIAMETVPVFKHNSRCYCVLETENFGTAIQIEVGALFVGKITNFHSNNTFVRGSEKGRFEFGGSTIILLFENNRINLDNSIIQNSQNDIETIVKMGEKIGAKIF